MRSRGVVYMAASALGFSAMSVLVKLATTRLPTGEIVLARSAITLVLSYVMVTRAGLHVWGTQHGRLVVRGFLGFGGLSFYYLALSRLTLADATILQNTVPLLTAVLAWWILDEKVGRPTAIALACGIVGVTIMVRPGAAGIDLGGVAIALAGATCSAIAYVTVRQLSRTEHPLVIVFYFPLIATPLAVPWAIADYVAPQPIDWLLLVAIGLTTQVGQVFLTMGLSVEKAGRATSVGYLQVMFAMVWQLAVFGIAPDLYTLGGAALIVAGTLVVATHGASEGSAGSPPPSTR